MPLEVFFIYKILLQDIEKTVGERMLFNINTASVYGTDKIGIVGQNGAGKTTLLNMIAGKMAMSMMRE